MHVRIDLARLRRNVQDITSKTAADLLAVVKADAYGLGLAQIAPAIADLVTSFCVFSLAEAASPNLWDLSKKPILVLGPPSTLDPNDYLPHHARPAVANPEQAAALQKARPLLSVDTGMQRFTCPPNLIDQTLRAGQCTQAFTHAIHPYQAQLLQELTAGHNLYLHAAATALLDDPSTHLSAVRPGLALYRGAVRVSTPLVEARDSTGPAGYSGFVVPRHGVILAGYSNGLRPGPCLINSRPTRLLEVGMQTSFIELAPTDKVSDEVVLLGDSLSEAQVAAAWNTSPQEVLVRLCGAGERHYVG